MLTMLTETHAIYPQWRSLALQHDFRGAKVHDTRLVAVMKVHNIRRIVTYNVQDFKRFADIEVIHPENVPALTQE